MPDEQNSLLAQTVPKPIIFDDGQLTFGKSHSLWPGSGSRVTDIKVQASLLTCYRQALDLMEIVK